MSAYEKISDDDVRHVRRVAFAAVVVSTVAVICAVVTLPMVYNYVQGLQTHIMMETQFCKVHSI